MARSTSRSRKAEKKSPVQAPKSPSKPPTSASKSPSRSRNANGKLNAKSTPAAASKAVKSQSVTPAAASKAVKSQSVKKATPSPSRSRSRSRKRTPKSAQAAVKSLEVASTRKPATRLQYSTPVSKLTLRSMYESPSSVKSPILAPRTKSLRSRYNDARERIRRYFRTFPLTRSDVLKIIFIVFIAAAVYYLIWVRPEYYRRMTIYWKAQYEAAQKYLRRP